MNSHVQQPNLLPPSSHHRHCRSQQFPPLSLTANSRSLPLSTSIPSMTPSSLNTSPSFPNNASRGLSDGRQRQRSHSPGRPLRPNGTFIYGKRLSGLESKPFELKSDDIVVSHFHSLPTSITNTSTSNQEFGIDIVGEDNKTIIHHKVAARVLCVFNEQDTQAAVHAEQQQLAQNPPGYTLSTHHQNMTSTAGPSNAFNFNGQGPTVGAQRRPAMQPQGLCAHLARVALLLTTPLAVSKANSRKAVRLVLSSTL